MINVRLKRETTYKKNFLGSRLESTYTFYETHLFNAN